MRAFIFIVTFFILTSCNNSDSQKIESEHTETLATDAPKRILKDTLAAPSDTTIIPNLLLTKLSVLVLPPFDSIANAGISPDIQKYLENILSTDTTLRLIKFPYQQLINVSYQNVFDKKYCKPITDKIKTDIIIMTKLDQATVTGNMTRDKWNFKIKIYNTNTGNQKISTLGAYNLTSTKINNLIKAKRLNLFTEIENNQ